MAKKSKKLREYVKSIASGATPKTTESDKYYTDRENGIPFLRVQNLSQTGVLEFEDCKYINEKTGEGFKLKSDLGHLMLWAPTTDMFCIEPITEKKEKGTQIDLTPGKSYKNVMMSGHKKTYHVEITPL